MKKLLSLLFITVAAMLPKSVWADAITINANPTITIDGTTLTINSTTAGSLKTLMDGWKTKGEKNDDQQAADSAKIASMKACTSVKLEGKFQENDLSAISNTQGFNFTVVDMAAAQFVTSISSTGGAGSYKLFKNIANTSTMDGAAAWSGDRAILNGTLYVSARTPQWDNMSPNYPAEGTTVYEISSLSNIEGRSIGDYGKVSQGFVYVQMYIGAASLTGPSTQAISTATDYSNNGTITEANINDHINELAEGQSYWFWRYYTCTQDGDNWVWNTTYSTDPATYGNAAGSKYDNPYGVNLNALDNNYAGKGNVMRVKVYYTKNVERTWSSPLTEKPSGTIYEVDGDYAYCDNHKTGYYSGNTWVPFNNDDWVRLINYNYYQLQATGAWRWEATTYNSGATQYINVTCDDISSASTPTPTGAGQYAIDLGTEYYYNGTSWSVTTLGSEVSDYSQMKFSYWSGSLVTATTSRYADETISKDIFQNCKKITHINYLGGNVTGLNDRTTGENYADFTVTIGKDVSKISSAAFSQSPALTGITFDKDYSSDKTIEGKTYPVELTIEDQAFKYCRNLFTVEIPNRCTFIGGNAFQEVGTGSVTDKNNVGTQDYTFTLTFERRNAADESTVGINCNLP